MSASTAVLAAGYLLAVPFAFYPPGFLRLWRRREPAVIVAEELGALLVTVGWAMKGNVPAALGNGLWTVGLAAALVAEGRKRARLSSV